MPDLRRPRPEGEATRSRILDAIRSQPGLNKSQLCNTVGLAWTTVEHHLRVLEKKGHVQLDHQARDVRCYVVGVVPMFRPWFASLLNPNRLRILQFLQDGELRIRDLRKRTGFSDDTLRRLLRQMLKESVIVKRGLLRPRFRIHPALPKTPGRR